MKPQVWPGIEDLLQEALKLAPDRREGNLAEVCGADAALRDELDSLIRADEKAGDFLARPAMAAFEAAGTVAERPMADPVHLSTRFLPGFGRAETPADDEHRFSRGTVIADRYRVIGFLGRGGMAEIYHAHDLKLDEPVALKFLTRSMTRNAKMRSRFLQEVKLARRVTHPNVCRVYDVGDVDGHLFLSMELIDGEDLTSLLKRVGRPSSEEALEILRQVCRGLSAIHDEGILHCDLKPANLMIDGRGRVRITDFGIAEVAGNITSKEALHGTPSYMAPEQYAGGEVDVRTDLFALGVAMFELLTGRRAIQSRDSPSDPPPSLGVDVEPAVERIVLRCMAKSQDDRPASVREVTSVLEHVPDFAQEFRPLHPLPVSRRLYGTRNRACGVDPGGEVWRSGYFAPVRSR